MENLKLAVVWLVLIATPLVAADREDTPEPGMLYRVSGLSGQETLSARKLPDEKSGQVGQLFPQTRDVVVTGSVADREDSVWWEIVDPNDPNELSWVLARYLAPQNPNGKHERNYPLQCGGTEPFWSMHIANDGAMFTSPDGDRSTWTAGSWQEALGRQEEFAIRLESPEGIGYAAVVRASDLCSDPMSDLQYPFHMLLIRPEGGVLAGCCARRR